MNTVAIKKTGSKKPILFLQSSLYELIEALNEEVVIKEDDLVTEAVLNLVKSGKIRWMREHQTLKRIR